jgi:hypothetical protein
MEVMMMKRSKLILMQMSAIALVQILAVTVLANPVWNGPGTTFQEWSFGTNSFAPSPDNGWVNPNGSPACFIGRRAVYSDNGGTWALVTDEMDIFIPNNPPLRPRKEMRIEIDWKAGSGEAWPGWPQRPLLSVFPDYGTSGLVVYPDITILQQGLLPGTPFTRTEFEVFIEPNPRSEWVVLKGDILVDHIAISTICIPEPATLGLLIGGTLMAIRRRRKV